MILYLVTGLIIGLLLGYLIVKLMLQKSHVSKTSFEEAQQKISALLLDNATRFTKGEVAQNYVTRELHESLRENLASAKESFEKEKTASETNRSIILRLTTESEQKLTKKEVEQSYVAT